MLRVPRPRPYRFGWRVRGSRWAKMAARVIGTLTGQLQPGVSVDRLNVSAEGAWELLTGLSEGRCVLEARQLRGFGWSISESVGNSGYNRCRVCCQFCSACHL